MTEPTWKGKIRPWGFIITLGMFFILLVIDGNFGTFEVREAYFGILETVLVTIVIAYYGSRGIEKTTATVMKGPVNPVNNEKDLELERPELDEKMPEFKKRDE